MNKEEKIVSEDDLTLNGELVVYEDKPFDGVCIEYFDTGHKESENYYKNGKLHGLRTIWYEDEKINFQAHYSNGKLDGTRTDWYKNGQKEYEGNYKNGAPEGTWTYWHDNGQKELEGNSEAGLKNGLVTEWSRDGKQIYQKVFKNDKEQ